MTTWKPVTDWEGLYEVSDDGRVRSLPRRNTKGRELRFGTTHNGYLTVTFSANGRREARTVHRVVADAFLGPLPEGLHRAHCDGDKTNNAVSNIRYVTPSENERDKRRHGTQYNVNKTHCPKGHAYTPDNLLASKTSSRTCKTCHRERNQRRRLAAKGLAPVVALPESRRLRDSA